MKTTIINKISAPVFALLALILCGATIGTAAPGDLDPTFGSGGIVVTRGNSINHLNTAAAMAIQSDGKIVVAGEGSLSSGTWDFAVVRYNTDGSLDTSFGGTGIVITPVGNSHDQAYSVAIQPDGKIVVAGTICNGTGNCTSAGSSAAIVRLNPNGSLDTSFNGTGKIINAAFGEAGNLVAQPDGKIVGSVGSGTLFRYNSDGTPDVSFGGTGIVRIQDTFVLSVALQSDGKIVIAAARIGDFGFGAARLNPDGSMDNTFNGTGIVFTQVGSSSAARDLAIQTDGKIVLAGVSQIDLEVPKNEFGFVRYHPNGSLDTSFGGTGKIIIPFGDFSNAVNSVRIQTDGKIVASGYSEIFDLSGGRFNVMRINSNGALDTTFGGTGKVTRAFCCQDFTSDAAIQSDGKIVVLGNTDDILYDFYDPVLVRYQGGSNANIRTRFDFDGDGSADVSVFRPSDRVWYLNRSTQGFAATQFGLSTDKLTPADYDGDGKTDISVYRDGTWWRINSSNSTVGAVPFGLASDLPVPADYSGDGRAEVAIYRGGVWWMLNLQNNQASAVQFGKASDKPVPADYDGDGRVDQAVYRDNGEWYLNQSTQGFKAVNFGLATDRPVPADFDGDGRTDFAVYRDGVWYLLQSTNGFAAFQWGLSSDVPVPADYDGDGKTDAAVYRNGTWYLLQSTAGISIQQFGLPSDKPVPAAYLP